jgi:serine protease Do
MWYARFKNSLKTRSGGFLVFFGVSFLIVGMILGVGLGPDLSLSSGEWLQVKDKAQPTADLEQEPLFSGALLVGQPSATLQNAAFTEVAKIARPAVVNISTVVKAESRAPLRSPFFDDPFFRRFFGEEFGEQFERRFQPEESPRQQGTGSGVIVSRDGYIITNNHVVEQGDDIQVTLSDKRNFTAEIVGTDPKTDLALLKIDADNLPVLPWGDSGKLEVGEIVMAIGNPFGLNQTVTMGIVSAVGRANVGIVDYEDFIQTDAAINPGNSGGALVNLKGELIGINTAIFTRSGGYMGIGFAIPSNMAKSIQASLTQHGKVIRGWLGVSIQDLTPDLQEQFDAPDQRGVLVSDVVEGSPAEEGGLKRGDIIRKYDSYEVNDSRHLRSLVAETQPDASVTIKVLRDGDEEQVKVRIAEMPKDLEALASSSDEARGKHALTGITVKPFPSGEKGVEVTEVKPGSAASRAGIREGDIIREINRQVVKDIEDFQSLTRKLDSDDRVLLLLQRGRTTIFLSITP